MKKEFESPTLLIILFEDDLATNIVISGDDTGDDEEFVDPA